MKRFLDALRRLRSYDLAIQDAMQQHRAVVIRTENALDRLKGRVDGVVGKREAVNTNKTPHPFRVIRTPY